MSYSQEKYVARNKTAHVVIKKIKAKCKRIYLINFREHTHEEYTKPPINSKREVSKSQIEDLLLTRPSIRRLINKRRIGIWYIKFSVVI